MAGFYLSSSRQEQRWRQHWSISGAGIAASVGGLLDSLAVTPTAALGIKKLVSTATSAIRVRRSSDNAEQDIGFSGTALDTAALASFVGANSAYVVTIYDQTGNGFHATQATAANQARIVNAGTYDGRLIFDGTNDSYKITALTQGTARAGIYGKFKMPNNVAVAIICEQSANYNSNAQSFALYRDNSGAGEFAATMRNTTGASDFRARTYGVNVIGVRQITTIFDRSLTGTGEIAVWDNGSTLGGTATSGTAEQTGTFSTYDVYIGARAGTSLFGNMQLESLVFYNADTASIRASIEAITA